MARHGAQQGLAMRGGMDRPTGFAQARSPKLTGLMEIPSPGQPGSHRLTGLMEMFVMILDATTSLVSEPTLTIDIQNCARI